MSKNHKIPSAEVVPLADRMRYMQAFRFSLVPVVALAVWLPATRSRPSVTALAAVTPPTSRVGAGPRGVARVARGGLFIFTAMLLGDGVYLAWTSYATGSGASPLRYLIILHIIAVALLASYRTGLKMALWHSLLLLVVYYAQEGGLLQPLDPRDAPASARRSSSWSSFSAVLWFVAHRHLHLLRDQRARAAPPPLRPRGARRHGHPPGGPERLRLGGRDAARLRGRRLRLRPGAVLRRQATARSSTLIAHTATWRAACSGRRPASGSVIDHAMATAHDAARVRGRRGRGRLAERAGARRQEPRDRAALGRGPRHRRARGRARHAPRLAHRAPGRWHARALRLPRRAGAAQRLAARAGPAAGRHRRAHRHRQPLHVPAGARARARARRARRRRTWAWRCSTSTTSSASTTPTATRPATRCCAAWRAKLSEHSRNYDTVARYGGEEFARDPAGAPTATRPRDRRAPAAQRRRVAGEPSVTISAGMATFPTDAAGVDELVAAADEALYESKRAGRNTGPSSSRHGNAAPAPRTPLAAPDVARRRVPAEGGRPRLRERDSRRRKLVQRVRRWRGSRPDARPCRCGSSGSPHAWRRRVQA